MRIVAVVAAAKLLLHAYAGRGYGFFIDELYYLACAEHLAWGYVDQPPLIAAIAWVARAVAGDNLWLVRLFPAVAGAATVWMAGLLAREMGGGRIAQATAALCVLLAPGLMAIDGFFSMNAFEPLFWSGAAWLVLRWKRTRDSRLWLWFGALCGVGLLNKHSMLLIGFGIVVGLLLTAERRVFASRSIWMGGAIALVVFAPNLWWNIEHGFPFFELQANIARDGRDVALTPWAFAMQEGLAMLPLAAPLWMAGLWWLWRRERVLGWAWGIAAVAIMALSPRVYYLFPAFPLAFAAGGVAGEGWLASHRNIGAAWVGALVLLSAALAPAMLPLLSPEAYLRYAAVTGIEQPRIENTRLQAMPQLFADQFGWEEMVAETARAFDSLPPAVRKSTWIFGQNYGQAGAIDLFGPKYGLPKAISGHQSYYLWGPRGYTGESLLVLGDRREVLEGICTSVTKMGSFTHPYVRQDQRFDIFHCAGLRVPVTQLWPKVKKWR